MTPEDSYSQPLRDEYILLNSFRNEGFFRFTCLVKYGSLQLFSETDPAVSWWRERGRESKERGRKVEGRGGEEEERNV